MNWEANRQLWEHLIAVYDWLSKDFLAKINHAATITAEDWQPFFAAHASLQAKRFQLDTEIFRLSRALLEDALYPNLGNFVATTNRQIQARDAGDSALQASLLHQMNLEYNQLVQAYAAELSRIQQVLEERFKHQPHVIENFIAGDVIFGDQISVGDITESSGIAIGKTITQSIGQGQPSAADEQTSQSTA